MGLFKLNSEESRGNISDEKRISELRNLRQLLLLDGDVFCEQFNMRKMKFFGVQNDFY